jgi:hypothetical protein
LAEQEAQEAFKSFDAKCREIISRHLPEYERTIGLTTPNHEFRSKVTDAIMACVFTHMLKSDRWRPSDLQRDLAKANKEARSAQNSLRKLSDILSALPELIRDEFTTNWGIFGEIAHRSLERQISWLVDLSGLTGIFSKHLKTLDRGGAPKMRAFAVLANGLADAYEIATGKLAGITWDEYDKRYDGEFLKLVQAVLPLAEKLGDMPKRPLRVPRQGKYALGKYLSTLTAARKKKRAQAQCKKP